MYYFSKKSLKNLNTCHEALRYVLMEAIKEIDFSVIQGYRNPAYQMLLYSKGRRLEDMKWTVINKSKIVTYKDGYKRLSKHNFMPSYAVDIQPYPNKTNIAEFKKLAKIIKSIWQNENNKYKDIYTLRWGGDFKNFKDLYHYEIKEIIN